MNRHNPCDIIQVLLEGFSSHLRSVCLELERQNLYLYALLGRTGEALHRSETKQDIKGLLTFSRKKNIYID